jgi:hypothetical protein
MTKQTLYENIENEMKRKEDLEMDELMKTKKIEN